MTNNSLKEPFVVDTPSDDEQPTPTTPIPISDARLQANRENAKLSSGAKTPAGKQIVSQNSTVHGLTGKFRVLSTETQSEFDELLAGLISSHAPADAAETELITSIAEALWLARRATRLQDRCLETIASGDLEAAKIARADLNLYMRYQTTHERSHQRYAAELRKLQSDRRKAEVGFVSQKHKEADQQRKQERHESTLAYIKSRLDHQLMKNRLLSVKVKWQDHVEAEEKRSEELRRKVEEGIKNRR
jgi:hypothetical protein